MSMPVDARTLPGIEEEFATEVTPHGVEFGAETWHEPSLDLWDRAAPRLAGAERLLVAPHGPLHRIPWMVVTARAGLLAPDGGPLPVLTLPSLQVASLQADMPPAPPGRRVVVGDPRGDLPYARLQAREVARTLDVPAPLMGERATVRAVLDALTGTEIAHVAAHAIFDERSPLRSGLLLADDVLTVRQLMERRIHCGQSVARSRHLDGRPHDRVPWRLPVRNAAGEGPGPSRRGRTVASLSQLPLGGLHRRRRRLGRHLARLETRARPTLGSRRPVGPVPSRLAHGLPGVRRVARRSAAVTMGLAAGDLRHAGPDDPRCLRHGAVQALLLGHSQG